MKSLYFFLVVLLTIQSGIAQINNYENGDTVNDFTVVDVFGNTHNLYSYTTQGKYVFLDFFYSDCGGCQNFISVFNEFYDKYGCNTGDVVCIAMNSGYDKDAAVIEFENTYGGTFNHAPAISRDGGCIDVNADFDPIYYPACVLVGPDNTMLNNDIHPIETVSDLEASFPTGFNPQPMNCSLGINDSLEDSHFTIYPNPSNNNKLVLNRISNSEARITIYNLLGEVVLKDGIIQTQKTITPNLTTGTYFVSLSTNRSVSTLKLIIL